MIYVYLLSLTLGMITGLVLLRRWHHLPAAVIFAFACVIAIGCQMYSGSGSIAEALLVMGR